jgi:SecD/SecF fusion protein
MVGLAKGIDTAKVNSYLKMIPIRALFPRDIKFYWSKNPHKYDASKSLYELHAIKPKNDGPLLSGGFVYAKASLDKKSSNVKINLKMYEGGARRLASITRFNIGRCIAIVVDDYVRSYPRVMTQITGGKTEITGDFTIEEADDLAIVLKSGKLPAEIKIVEEHVTKGE